MKSIFKIIKNKLNSFFVKLAKSNEKEFGDSELHCCDLNKKRNSSSHWKTIFYIYAIQKQFF